MIGLRAIKERLGPLWWYAAIMFGVQRVGDLINLYIGLFLVPQYVDQAELGAVLPLAQVGSALGLPLSILLIPFTKFLNLYATRGEYGKVKRLLCDAFVLSAVIFGATLVYARVFLPLVFERMRVVDGRLSLLIVATGIVGTLTPVFGAAIQALKKFRFAAFMGLAAAPVRLVTVLVCLPIRALSGYFMGQLVPMLLSIALACFGLRPLLGRSVKAEPYWRRDWRPILAYMLPVAALLVAGTLQQAVETFVIRHRLPDLESAGFYMISRLAELSAHTGITLGFILFPLAAESHARGGRSHRLLWQAMGGSFGVGLALAAALAVCGPWLLGLVPAWRPYAGFAPQMALLAVVLSARAALGCFMNFELACGRFAFVWYFALLGLGECAVLYGLTGYAFFDGLLPDAWVAWMASLRAARLEFLLGVMLVTSFVTLAGALAQALRRRVVP